MSLAVHYEDLSGAEGPGVRYRPERFRARALYGQFPPEVEIGGVAHKIIDLSMSGLAVAVRRDQLDIGEPGTELELRLLDQDAELFRGRARVCRVEPTPFHTKVALHLIAGYLDLPKTVAQHRKLLAQHTVGAGPGVDPRYREHCADVLHLLRRHRAALEEIDRSPVSDYIDREKLEAELLPLCEERLLPEWREIWHAGNALTAPLMTDPEQLQAVKRYTELVLTPEFMPGPLWRRGYEKPLGYPGDFEMMNSVYAWDREGESAYGKLLHRIGLDVAECISTRMVLMEQAIAEAVGRKPGADKPGPGETGDDPVRITSLGCGPAQEVMNYLRIKSRPRRVEFTLIDQDERALSCAYARTYPEVVRLGDEASVNCLHISFSQVMRAGPLFQKLPLQDLIYSVGLVDYLSARRARAFVTDLYDQLAPGGLLIVGNMRDTPHGNLWPLEFISDWSLAYRNAEEMRDMAGGIGPAELELRTDPTGRIYLLRMRKPGRQL